MGVMTGKDHMSTCGRKIWTGTYVLTWILLFIGMIIYHIAIDDVVPYLENLPKNIKKGFDDTFKFANLETDSLDTKTQATTALAKCGVTPPCSGGGSALQSSQTAAEKAKITKNFDSSLSTVAKVCNDKYFGTEALQDTGRQLNEMMSILDQIPVTDSPCAVTNGLYCSMYSLADGVIAGVGGVNKEIDSFTTSDEVKAWEDNAEYLNYLHALPYMLVISALFLACGWYLHGSCWCCCCCRKGQAGARSCLWVLPHSLFWFVFFIINSIIVVIGYVVQNNLDEVKLDMLNNKPTLDVFIDHVQAVYPDFWNVVFGKMETGLEDMWKSALIFEVFCILIVVYGCCMCCIRPYRDLETDQVVPVAQAASYEQQQKASP